MVWQHIWKDKQSKSFSFVLLSRVYKNKGELELSFHYLKKAEKDAIDSELYEVLSIIYSEIIQISHELLSVDVDHYIKLKRNNIKILSEIDEMDILLAKIMYDIKTKQNFGKSDGSLVKLITTKYAKISKEKNLVNSPRFRIRLFKMYSRLLLQERDYQSLEKFLLESYNDFLKDKLLNRSNHNEKLTLLTYLTNCLYKPNKHKKSLKYADKLFVSMKNLCEKEKVFEAYLSLKREKMNRKNLFKSVLRFPFITLTVFLRIHWNAFKLWFKGAQFHIHPDKIS